MGSQLVRLNRIYTKSGDGGETSLGDGTRVPKTDVRVRGLGAVDELNCVIGRALAGSLPGNLRTPLAQIQNELFDVGADLSCPFAPNDDKLRVTATQVSRLEHWIDTINEPLSELESFVLPGGTVAAAELHLARAVCRRAELAVLAIGTPVNPLSVQYLNRLSDLLFVMARAANDTGQSDVLWVPGKDRDAESPPGN